MAEINDMSPESGLNTNHECNASTEDDNDISNVKPTELDIQDAEGENTEAEHEKGPEDNDNNKSNINNDNNSTNNNNNKFNNVREPVTLLEITQRDEIKTEEEDDDLSYLYDTDGNNDKNKNDKNGKKSPLFQDDDWENRVKQLREDISETEQKHTLWQKVFYARRDGAIERWKEIKKKKQQQIQKINKLKNLANGNAEENTDSTEEITSDQTKHE